MGYYIYTVDIPDGMLCGTNRRSGRTLVFRILCCMYDVNTSKFEIRNVEILPRQFDVAKAYERLCSPPFSRPGAAILRLFEKQFDYHHTDVRGTSGFHRCRINCALKH